MSWPMPADFIFGSICSFAVLWFFGQGWQIYG